MKSYKISKLLQIMTMLLTGQNYSVNDLAKTLNVSKRTVFRYLDDLRDAGIPCYYDNRNHSYRIDSEFFMPVPNLTEQEALSLFLLVYKFKDYINLPFNNLALKAALKIESKLPEKTKRYCNNVLTNISVKAQPNVKENFNYEIFILLQQAILRKRVVNICYNSFLEEKVMTFELYPYHLLLNKHKWYVIGKSSIDKKDRAFHLEQITKIEIQNKCFIQDEGFDVSNYLGRAWSISTEGVLYNVKLRFVPEIASEVVSTQWHETQRVTFEGDGSVLIEFRIDGLDEIIPWILGFGNLVEVLKPKSLQQKILATAIATCNSYSH